MNDASILYGLSAAIKNFNQPASCGDAFVVLRGQQVVRGMDDD